MGRPRADTGLIDRLKGSRVTFLGPIYHTHPGRQSIKHRRSCSRRARRSVSKQEEASDDQGPRQDPTQPRIMQVKVKTLKGQMVEVPAEDATLVRVMHGVFACLGVCGYHPVRWASRS